MKYPLPPLHEDDPLTARILPPMMTITPETIAALALLDFRNEAEGWWAEFWHHLELRSRR